MLPMYTNYDYPLDNIQLMCVIVCITLNAAIGLLMCAWREGLAVVVSTNKILITFIVLVTVSLVESASSVCRTKIPILLWSNPNGLSGRTCGGGSGRWNWNNWKRLCWRNSVVINYVNSKFFLESLLCCQYIQFRWKLHLDLQQTKRCANLKSSLDLCHRFGSRWWSSSRRYKLSATQRSWQRTRQPNESRSHQSCSTGVFHLLHLFFQIFWGSHNLCNPCKHEPQSGWTLVVWSCLQQLVFFHSFSTFVDSCR